MNIALAALLVLCAGTCLAQSQAVADAQPQEPAPPAFRLEAPLGVFQCDDEVVAIGPGYKAYLRPGAVEFVPAFGPAAARNMSLHLRATGLQRQDTAQPFAAVPVQLRSGQRAEYAVAPGVREVYEPTARGLEQSFVFAERPAGEGDLVVQCRILTELVPTGHGDGTDVRFELPGVGTVTIGGVLGIDANGHRAAGSLRLEGSTLSLVLPAQFVDTAAYPLVLDPLLGAAAAIGPLNSAASDVVYDPATADWLVIWSQPFSGLDYDVYGLRVDAAGGAPVGGAWPIDAGTGWANDARAGTVRSTGRALVAFLGGPGFNDVVMRTVNVATHAVSTAVVLAADGLSVDVGSEATTSDNEVVVTWSYDDVFAARVTVNGGVPPVAGPTVTLGTASIGSSLEHVAISRTSGTNGVFLVTWNSAPGVFTPGILLGCAVSRNAAPLTSVYALNTNPGVGAGAVDTKGGTLLASGFLVACQQFEPGSTTLRDIACISVTYQVLSHTLTVGTPTVIEGTAGQDEVTPRVGWLGSRYAVLFAENPGLSTENVAAWMLNPDCTACGSRMNLTGASPLVAWSQERGPKVCGRAAWTGDDDGMVVYTERNPTTSQSDVVLQRIEVLGPGGAIVDLGGACGNGGVASTAPSGFALGNADFRFQVSGLEAGTLPFCCLALPAPTLVCGPCVVVNPVIAAYEPNVGGVATHAFPLGCGTADLGLQVEVQWLSFGTTTSPCPILLNVSASNRVRMTVGQ